MPETKTIRILIADDHEMVRHGLAGFLGAFPDFQLVGQASNGTQAVKLCGDTRPDVVLMDLIMPEMDGVTATNLIKEKYPEIQVIALTSAKDEATTNRALQAGAIAYLHKDISIHDLGNAIRSAAVGKPTLSPDAFSVLVKSVTAQPPTNQDFTLTNRELDVLRLLVKERTNAEIAVDLSISLSTVKTHISNIMSKLGVRTRSEAVRVATQNRLFGT
ncbi:MAG: response regulator transcription factor [Anaerolineae bacterium]|nr:response regulator transcription factor [Anaerolineae bacterium]